MGVMQVLRDIRDLVESQTDAVIQGDARALQDGAARHEQLLELLKTARRDGTDEEVGALAREIERAKTKLTALLNAESLRVDYFMRTLMGQGQSKNGYPAGAWREPAAARVLNRKA